MNITNVGSILYVHARIYYQQLKLPNDHLHIQPYWVWRVGVRKRIPNPRILTPQNCMKRTVIAGAIG